MTGFDKYHPKGKRASGCPRCGAPTAGHVAVVLRGKTAKEHITSATVSFCEAHAIEIYDAFAASLEGERK